MTLKIADLGRSCSIFFLKSIFTQILLLYQGCSKSNYTGLNLNSKNKKYRKKGNSSFFYSLHNCVMSYDTDLLIYQSSMVPTFLL